jgi:hypothetical protein
METATGHEDARSAPAAVDGPDTIRPVRARPAASITRDVCK